MITEDDIKKAASLGEINLTPEESEVLKDKLSLVFDCFSVLDSVNIKNQRDSISKKSNLVPQLREDIVKKNENYLDLLQNILDLEDNGIVISGIRN